MIFRIQFFHNIYIENNAFSYVLSSAMVAVLLSVNCTVKSAISLHNSSQMTASKHTIQCQQSQNTDALKVSSYIDSIKSNSEKYIWGEGVANIGIDLGDAKIKARDRALDALSQTISVTIQSEIKSILVADEKGILQDDLIEKTRTYTETVIHNVNQRDFIDYPEVGNITCISYILRKNYIDIVQMDLESKKAMIRDVIRNATIEFNNRNYITSLHGWFTALEYKNNFFGGLPLSDYIDSDTVPDEVNSYLYGKINSFIGGLHLSFLQDTIVYDVSGKLNNYPVVFAQYKEENSSDLIPVTNAPVVISYMDNLFKPVKLATGIYGQAECKNIEIDPSKSHTNIIAELDTTEFEHISNMKLPNVRTNSFILKRMKTVAVSAMINNNGRYLAADDLLVAIKAYALESKLNVIQMNIESNTTLSNEQLSSAANSNADFLLALIVDGTGTGNVGGYANMFVAQCNGSISLYDLKTNSLIATEKIGASKGFGTTVIGAIFDAFSKMKKQSQTKAFAVINKIPL